MASPGASNGRNTWTKRRAGIGPERRGSVFQDWIDARQVGQRKQERERESGDQQGRDHAPVVVDQPNRVLDQPDGQEGAIEPALWAEVVEQAFGNQHRAEGDRDDQDGGQQALPAQQPNPKRDRHRQHKTEHRDRNRDVQRRQDRVVEIGVRKEGRVIGRPTALLRLERQDQAVGEGIEEQGHDQGQGRQDQERDGVEPAQGKALAQAQTGVERERHAFHLGRGEHQHALGVGHERDCFARAKRSARTKDQARARVHPGRARQIRDLDIPPISRGPESPGRPLDRWPRPRGERLRRRAPRPSPGRGGALEDDAADLQPVPAGRGRELHARHAIAKAHEFGDVEIGRPVIEFLGEPTCRIAPSRSTTMRSAIDKASS